MLPALSPSLLVLVLTHSSALSKAEGRDTQFASAFPSSTYLPFAASDDPSATELNPRLAHMVGIAPRDEVVWSDLILPRIPH